MRLNDSARPWISSPVCSSIGWSSLPAPIRAAPSWSTRIGATIRRARKRLARIDGGMRREHPPAPEAIGDHGNGDVRRGYRAVDPCCLHLHEGGEIPLL